MTQFVLSKLGTVRYGTVPGTYHTAWAGNLKIIFCKQRSFLLGQKAL
jgi:hypothetical protein